MEEKKLTLIVIQIDGDVTASIESTGFNLAEIVGHLEHHKQGALRDWQKKAKSGKKKKTEFSQS